MPRKTIKISEEIYNIFKNIKEKNSFLTFDDIIIMSIATNPDERIQKLIGEKNYKYFDLKSRAKKERILLYIGRSVMIKAEDKITILKNLRTLAETHSSKKDIKLFLDMSLELNVDADDNKFRNFLINLKKELENKSNRDCYMCIRACLEEYLGNVKEIGGRSNA